MDRQGFKRLKIQGWRQFHAIDIEVHPRLTIITGANGAGKSTILSFLTRHFGYNRDFLATPQTKSGIVSFTFGIFKVIKRNLFFSGQYDAGQGTRIGEIEYASGQQASIFLPPSQGLNYSISIHGQQHVDGVHIDSHRPPNIYRHVSTISTASPSSTDIGNGLNSEYMNYYSNGQINQGSLHHIKLSLIQMSIFGHGNNTMEPNPELIRLFSGFEQKLREILPPSLGFERLVIRSPEVLLSTKSGDFLIDAASGGVIKLIEVAWQIYFYSQGKSGFVVTFDEPENHLHPSMQKSFLPNIMKAFPNTQIIVVTHSPFIISAMRDSFVYVLRYEDTDVASDGDDQSIKGMMGSRVYAEQLDTVNKAGTASEILRDVLGITTTIPDWAEDRVEQIVADYQGWPMNKDTVAAIYAQLEREGLAASYPTVLASLTRPQ
ncbi:AAA family ATPase [Sphingomonas alpina]|uniref:AAA family ATPase n=1 Tax=Sphingomonas alpina TaxID=653931 RepID=A0A7H0LM39_9SPHN|nr:AAA family ATPase [Sphingomonas alpina]QNQ10742.1 AAA family ATPase [Sphingomonas alpina]